ncbi:hypothetical protein [Galactobacter sp.]|uniref:hypothetical protein n=1 Tax=Galactobacter sp. TaxID=2676125 RepID=UPI0025C36304|nr:hypothetical protein [Galactobacter sp.]
MRRTVPIILLVLGVVSAVIGVGRLSFWAPPATLSVESKNLDTEAPLTLITQPVREFAGDGASLTVHADGKFRAVVGRAEDVDAWVGDASRTVFSGVDEDNGSFSVQQVPGSSTAPNPAGSDLWVADAQQSGEWTASWSSGDADDQNSWTPPADGEWTMLLATDGQHAAPTEMSMTWDNPAATPAAKFGSAVWWFVGALVLLIAALIFFRRKPRERGRRAAAPAAPGSRRASREAERGTKRSSHGTEASTSALPVVTTAASSDETLLSDDDTVIRPLAGDDETMIRPLDLPDVPEADTEDLADLAESEEYVGPVENPTEEDDMAGNDDSDLPGGPAEDDSRRGGPGRGVRWRRGAAVGLAASALVLPAGSAWAAPQTSVTVAADEQQGESSEADAHPVLVESQLQRILDDVSAAQAKGDKSRKAKDLGDRFAGPALELRTNNYANRGKGVSDVAAIPAIDGDQLRAAAVTTTSQWPRVVMLVTQGQNQSYPVTVTLEQKSPRSNYAVVQSVPMVEDAKLPAVILGSPEVVTQAPDQDGLAATPAEAANGFADVLKNSKSKWAQKFDDSKFVTQWHTNVNSFTKALKKADPDASFQTSFSVDSGSTKVLASPQGGSYVSADVTITTAAKPSQGGSMTLPGDAGKLTGEKETSKSVVTTYQVPIFLYIPAAGDGKIRVVGAAQQVTGIDLK